MTVFFFLTNLYRGSGK